MYYGGLFASAPKARCGIAGRVAKFAILQGMPKRGRRRPIPTPVTGHDGRAHKAQGRRKMPFTEAELATR